MSRALRREDLSFVDRAPLRIEAVRTITAPPAEVWAGVGDAEAWTDWFPNLKVARYTSPPPIGVGSQRHVEVQGLKVDEELLAFDPGERYAFVVHHANLPGIAALVEHVTLEPSGDGTLVTYVQAIELARWLSPLSPLVRRQLGGALRGGLEGLDRWVATHRSDR